MNEEKFIIEENVRKTNYIKFIVKGGLCRSLYSKEFFECDCAHVVVEKLKNGEWIIESLITYPSFMKRGLAKMLINHVFETLNLEKIRIDCVTIESKNLCTKYYGYDGKYIYY
jgi:hypothetical protein